KETTDQLDWNNPEGQQYPHDLLNPLPLIPNSRGCRIIPFDHFINNDLEYLRGGALSRKYTTLVTKTKPADYGHIKWIEDLVPRTISMDLWSIENLLEMFTPNVESSLSQSFKSSNGITTSIWIGSLTIDDNMKRIIKEQIKSQVKDQVSRILPRIEQSVNAQLESKVLTRSSHSSRTSYAVAADLLEMELNKILIEKMEGNKRKDDDDQEGPSAGSDRGSKRRREGGDPESASTPSEPATRSAGRSTTGSQSRQMSANESAFAEEPVQTTCQIDEPSYLVFDIGANDQPIVQSSQHPECELAKQVDSRSSFNELLDTPLDFSNFIMNRLRVDTLTPELLAGPTYELIKGSCNSLIELEYHLEEVYKATTDQLDWVKPEGQQYPHNMLQPLPLIPDNQGRRVIPFAHFINNDLEYLRGGVSSRKYTTSVTKTKAADYRHIIWIEDLVPRTMWIQEPINYDKHALWGVFHYGQKRQQFYGFIVNRESALNVYSKRRIITVTGLKIVKWHNYKHLDWISIRRDDDKVYKFKEGDFKRLRLQDIEDMLLLLVQGKLSNLTVEERFTFNVSLRMFTRSIVIQRRVEDL
nr:hypothetical protein [Tanacetum cinerariifolium]